MIKIHFNESEFLNKNNIKQIKKICKIISSNQKISENLFLELSLIDNSQMKDICKKYYSKKETTDVLSFPNTFYFKKNKKHIGEIFINNNEVINQSKKLDHSYEKELFFLFIHGTLHLLGFNHKNKKEENEMIELQKIIIKEMEN